MNPCHQFLTNTCLHRFDQLQVPLRKVVHTHLKRDVHKEGTRLHQPSYVPNRKYESKKFSHYTNREKRNIPLSLGHRDCNGIWDTACSCLKMLVWMRKGEIQ